MAWKSELFLGKGTIIWSMKTNAYGKVLRNVKNKIRIFQRDFLSPSNILLCLWKTKAGYIFKSRKQRVNNLLFRNSIVLVNIPSNAVPS